MGCTLPHMGLPFRLNTAQGQHESHHPIFKNHIGTFPPVNCEPHLELHSPDMK